MKLELKEYQEVAAARILAHLRNGSKEFVADGEYTAVSLAAPTASGKTVIAAAVIERMLYGSDEGATPADPEAIFLWLTDDPSLNAQTRKKLLSASDRLQPGQLKTIDDEFDKARFEPGCVYFLNIQKLAKSSNLVKRAEGKRDFPIWETITNSVDGAGAHYYLVIDEAHRGTGTRYRHRGTLAQRLISGREGSNPPSPVVWGISATPKRFEEAMDDANPVRTMRKVPVPVEEVRESGLLKDVLSIHHQAEKQVMETTLLREAIRNLKEIDAAWAAYAEAEEEPPVSPALVIQIPSRFSDEESGELLDVCFEEWGQLAPEAVAHSLESHTAEEFGQHTVRYVAPQDIQDHPSIRVVLFKEALTTGWDCPRAEVMFSLRKAEDDTYIAQLIGRMVRTPLARRIESVESLNRVFLYLPHFNHDAVLEVKEQLEADPEGPITDVVVNSVEAARNADIPAAVFNRCEELPSYIVPSSTPRAQVARLHKLAGLLAGDDLLAGAVGEADAFLVSVLESERSRLEADGALATLRADVEKASVEVLDVALYSGEEYSAQGIELTTDSGDVDRLFRGAARKFRDGIASTYWGERVSAHGEDPYGAKVLTVALSWEPTVSQRLEAEAEARVQQWLASYGDEISTLSADKKARYAQVRTMAKRPEAVTPTLPSVITMAGTDDVPAATGHLFADSEGKFRPPKELGSWEQHVIATEQNRDGFLAWYRNPTGGEGALRIPYEKPSGFGKLYPDFLFFHEDGAGEIQVSIIDPHGHHFSDAGPKLRGLGAYAEAHGGLYSRVIAVIKAGNEFLLLDLTEPSVRDALATVSSREEIEEAFKTYGAKYG